MLAVMLLSSSKLVAASVLNVGLLLAACHDDKPIEETKRKPASVQHRVSQPVAPPAPIASKSICVITDDSLAGQPFGAEPTIEELVQAGAAIVVRKPFANLHERGQIDTIIVLVHRGNRFEFYRAPEKDLLRHAVITNFQPTYGRHLQSGISGVSRRKSTGCQNLRIGDTERTNYINVTYSGSKISTVKVDPYVD